MGGWSKWIQSSVSSSALVPFGPIRAFSGAPWCHQFDVCSRNRSDPDLQLCWSLLTTIQSDICGASCSNEPLRSSFRDLMLGSNWMLRVVGAQQGALRTWAVQSHSLLVCCCLIRGSHLPWSPAAASLIPRCSAFIASVLSPIMQQCSPLGGDGHQLDKNIRSRFLLYLLLFNK